MPNPLATILNEMRGKMCRPEGALTFDYTSDTLFDPNVTGGVIFDLVAKAHIFRLDRTTDLQLRFIHASPGTGTRVATLDLRNMPTAKTVFIALSWSPDDVTLHLGPTDSKGSRMLYKARGQRAPFELQVATDGTVFQIGDEGIAVMAATVRIAGKTILTSAAIQTWRETKHAVSLFIDAIRGQQFIIEGIAANMAILMLVSGLEVYCKKRFLEIEQEGIAPDLNAIVNQFYSNPRRSAGVAGELAQAAAHNSRTVLAEIVDRRVINFQDYESAKRAFRRAYGIRFGELGVSSDGLDAVQTYLRYRHQIVHVSPLPGMLNPTDVPSSDPVISTPELAGSVLEVFEAFVSALHASTLKLRPVRLRVTDSASV